MKNNGLPHVICMGYYLKDFSISYMAKMGMDIVVFGKYGTDAKWGWAGR